MHVNLLSNSELIKRVFLVCLILSLGSQASMANIQIHTCVVARGEFCYCIFFCDERVTHKNQLSSLISNRNSMLKKGR